MLLTISRWFQRKELENDLRVIRQLPPEAKGILHEQVTRAIIRIELDHKVHIWDIFDSTSYHPVENSGWALSAIVVNNQYRLPAIQKAKAGDDSAMFMQLTYGVILHSIRAILDLELRNKKEMMLYCKSMWYYIAEEDFSRIPLRFRRE